MKEQDKAASAGDPATPGKQEEEEGGGEDCGDGKKKEGAEAANTTTPGNSAAAAAAATTAAAAAASSASPAKATAAKRLVLTCTKRGFHPLGQAVGGKLWAPLERAASLLNLLASRSRRRNGMGKALEPGGEGMPAPASIMIHCCFAHSALP